MKTNKNALPRDDATSDALEQRVREQTLSLEKVNRELKQEISERRRAEEQLIEALYEKDIIINTVQDIIIRLDADKRLVSWNREAEVVTGYSAAELLHTGPEIFFSGKEFAETESAISQCIKEGYSYVEAALKLKSGDTILYQWALASLDDSENNLVGFAIVGRDLSDRIEAERQRLTDAERQRDTLVREVQHRVKNNLQGIVGLLRHYTHENPQTREIMETAIGQIQSMALMYGLQSRHSNDDVLVLDMVTAIADNAQSITSAIVKTIGGEFDEDLLAISAKENIAVALILNELIFNAIKHSPCAEKKQVLVSIEQSNKGIEIAIENIGNLPEAFHWANGKGCGTGLTLVRSLLPKRGVSIAFNQNGQKVRTILTISSPALVQSGITSGSETGQIVA
jgi:PAS domain S-box-containing protein